MRHKFAFLRNKNTFAIRRNNVIIERYKIKLQDLNLHCYIKISQLKIKVVIMRNKAAIVIYKVTVRSYEL